MRLLQIVTGDGALVELSRSRARRLELDVAQRRLTIRDDNDLPLVDLHKEAGGPLTIRWSNRSYLDLPAWRPNPGGR